MPTSPTRRACAHAGFTLVEMLAVLAVLALSAALVIPRLSDRRTADKVASATAGGLALLRETRELALRSGQPQVAYIDVAGRRLIDGAGRQVQFPADDAVTFGATAVERYPNGLAGVRFFDSGGSSGGLLTITVDGRVRRIHVDWLTGRAWADGV
jgi:general secretion pathway protein H